MSDDIIEESGLGSLESTKPSSGRRPSWQRRNVDATFDAAIFLEIKTGFDLRRGFAAVRLLVRGSSSFCRCR